MTLSLSISVATVAVPAVAPPMRKFTSLIDVGLLAWLTRDAPCTPTWKSTGELTGPASIRNPAICTPSTSATVIAAVPVCGTRSA